MPEANYVESRRLLKELDDPTHLEFPADYNRDEVERSFNELVGLLEASFGTPCRVDAGVLVQDASFFGQIVVPAAETRSGGDLFVRVSNFGKLVVFGLTAPGAYSVDELGLLLSTGDRELIERALVAGGFVAVAEDLLWERYDGTVQWLIEDTRPTWFTRFFDYL